MKKVGDSIQWNTKFGVASGIIETVRVRFRYLVKIDNSESYVILGEDESPSEVQQGWDGRELLQAVQQMRDAQRRYFDTKDTTLLNESKRLEKKVDAIIEMFQTPSLFSKHQE